MPDSTNTNTPAPTPITDDTWLLSCPTCGRWKPLAELGGIRIGAKSIGKRILGHCSSCGTLRMMRLEQPKQIPHDHLSKMIENTPAE